MDHLLLVRAAGLYVPVCGAAALWVWRRPGSPHGAGILLAFLWNAVAFCPVHLAAQHFGWWHFQASGGLFLGFPVDLYLAWIVLWGVIPLLGFPSFSLPGTIAIFLLVDVVIMPALNPLLTLGRWWYLGEAMAAGFCLFSSQILGRWTRDRDHLYGRAALQVIVFSGFLIGLLPAIILANSGSSSAWMRLLDRPAWLNGLLLQR